MAILGNQGLDSFSLQPTAQKKKRKKKKDASLNMMQAKSKIGKIIGGRFKRVPKVG